MRRAILAVLTGVLVAVVAFGAAAPAGVLVKLNEVQVIGTHNSYHIEPPADLLEMLINIDPAAKELAYSHPPLGDQFSYEGVRQIELDVYADPAGTLWRPIGRSGFKVFHIEGFDERSTCEVFVDCLAEVKAWSDARPAHMPIAILIEVKDNADLPGPPDPIPVGPAELDALDAEIRSVFAADRLIEPDDVRGARPTLEEAVLAGEWPAIDDVRGDVIFLLDNKRDEYRSGHPSLEGRVAFTPSSPGQPDAAFIKENDPTGAKTAEIQGLVAAGYVVRTRADTPVLTPQAGDTSQRDAALASGAQWVSTDYPVPGYAERWGSDYVAAIPGGNPARCNPVNGPAGCTAALIEDLPPEQRPTTTTTSTTSTAPAAVTVTPAFTG
ncbi:MAG: phosphatidylinositol-specific phospholipase C1-like protein [Acidimicrobiales bacterium]|nr:phosphatidylinositol-specific phospholipase C1-like protein [Acidimicrobiales bacterium]MCB1262015.1 phosphatidylinositol-specific phospholipase C1-like protein [Acidimicrobiales bacterium]